MGRMEVENMMNELLSSEIFTVNCHFSKDEICVGDDRRILIEGMMLLDTSYVDGFVLNDFSEASILEYEVNMMRHYSDLQSNMIRSAVEYLTAAFAGNSGRIEKDVMPMLIYLSDEATDAGIKPESFRRWWNGFTKEGKQPDACGMCSLKEKLYTMAESFCDYHKIEMFEDLKKFLESETF